MNNESKKYIDSFSCLEFLPVIETAEKRAEFYSGICSSNNLTHEEMVETADRLGLFNQVSSISIGDVSAINEFYRNSSDCKKHLLEMGAEKKLINKVCVNCKYSPKYSNKYIGSQEKIIAGIYKFGPGSVPKEMKSYMTYTVYFAGNKLEELKSYQISVRGELLKLVSDESGFSSKDKLISTLIYNVLHPIRRKASNSDIICLESEIRTYALLILQMDVSEDELKEAYAALVEHIHNEKKDPVTVPQMNIEEAIKEPLVTDSFPQPNISGKSTIDNSQEEELSVEDNNLIMDESMDPVTEEMFEEPSDQDVSLPNNETDDIIPDAHEDNLSREGLKVAGQESEGSVQKNESNGVQIKNIKTEDFIDDFIPYSYSKGILLEKSIYANTFITLQVSEAVRTVLDILYSADSVSVEIVNCNNVHGLMIYSKCFDKIKELKGRPVFIKQGFYTNRLFDELLNSNLYHVITMNLELLCAEARKYNVNRFVNCFSIRAAYKALHDEVDTLYPFKQILDGFGIDTSAATAPFIQLALVNYEKIRNSFIFELDTKHFSKRAHIWKSYECVLSTSNHSIKMIGLQMSNLHRKSYSSNTFEYKLMPGANNSCTILSCNFNLGADNKKLPSRFIPNLLNQIFNTAPFKDLNTGLLEYGEDHISVVLNTRREENIVVAFEVLHTILVRLCLRSKLNAPRFTDKLM